MNMYDDIDMKNAHNLGYWTGVLVGSLTVFILCLFVGIYIS